MSSCMGNCQKQPHKSSPYPFPNYPGLLTLLPTCPLFRCPWHPHDPDSRSLSSWRPVNFRECGATLCERNVNFPEHALGVCYTDPMRLTLLHQPGSCFWSRLNPYSHTSKCWLLRPLIYSQQKCCHRQQNHIPYTSRNRKDDKVLWSVDESVSQPGIKFDPGHSRGTQGQGEWRLLLGPACLLLQISAPDRRLPPELLPPQTNNWTMAD